MPQAILISNKFNNRAQNRNASQVVGPTNNNYCNWSLRLYVYIYSPDMDIQKYTVTMKIIVNSVNISSLIGTISNSEVVDLQ